MKKMFLLVAIFAVLFTGCNIKTTVSGNIGIPRNVSHIEFWNGGGLMAEYDNALVETKIDTATKAIGADIYFYRYEITVGGVTEVIVDSESLAVKYRK